MLPPTFVALLPTIQTHPLALRCTTATKACATQPSSAPPARGTVTLVSVGPGSASLLTPAALTALTTADIVLYDRLIGPEILHHLPVSTPRIPVGKARGLRTASQPSLSALLATLTLTNAHVVRVKAGDASIFARLHSELAALRAANIDHNVIPGITTASALAASLAFPLTMPPVAKGVTMVTGHDGASWFPASQLRYVTLVVYMGLQAIDDLCKRLTEEGGDEIARLPAVAVQGVATPTQTVVWGCVSSIAEHVRVAALSSPTLFVLGKVVSLARDWPYERIEMLKDESNPGKENECDG